MVTEGAPFSVEDFQKVLVKELGVFKEGEEYDYSKDMKHAYQNSLKTSTEQKIFNTIPDHVFWDIKTPQQAKSLIRLNRYNTFRGREFNNFFEMRASE
jgi:hypothetical protein